MRYKKNTSHRKIIIVSSLVTLLMVGGLMYIFREELNIGFTKDDNGYSEPTADELSREETAEQKEPNNNQAETPQQSDENSPQVSANEIILSSINQNGDTLAVRTIIQPLVTGGTCTLNMSKSGQETVRMTASVQSMPSYSTCQGFDINVAGMEKGSWNIEVVHTNNDESISRKGTAVVR